MDWFKTSETRGFSIEDPNTPIAKALMFLGDGRSTLTGKPMNEGQALSISAFFNGVSIIAGDLATVGLKLYRKRADGGREEETGHALTDLLTLEPYPMVTSAAWRESGMGHLLLRGNAYSEIISDRSGNVTGILPIDPRHVTRKGEIYEVTQGMSKVLLHASQVLHVAGPGGGGVDGWSVITLARENLSLVKELEVANTSYIVNSSRPSGFLSNPNPMPPEAAKRLKEQWAKQNAGAFNAGNVPVLDGGITWQQVGLNAEDAQYLESRKFGVTDVARWLNIPSHKLKDYEHATFSNIEHLAIDYVVSTLRPWAVRWEQAMNTKLLTERERKQGLYVQFNLDTLLRGDIEARTNAYQSQFNMGGLTPNELRALENRNPIEGGDEAYVRLDTVPISMAKELQAAKQPAVEPEPRQRRSEIRSPDARMALRNAFLGLFLDVLARMVRGEARNIKRILSRAVTDAEMRAAIAAYYFDDHPSFATGLISPVFRSYAESMSGTSAAEVDSDVRIDTASYADAYNESFVARYSASSRRALVDLEALAIEERLQEWQAGTEAAQPRHIQVANREIVRLGDAVAKATWVSAGVTTFIWRTVGDNCPYCKRLNGKVVGVSQPFIPDGTEFEGEGTDVPLKVKGDVGHAPAHRGCDCTIVPGR